MASTTQLAALRNVLGLKNKMGARTAVLVVGDGINIQALRGEPSHNRDDWSSILRRIAQKAGISGAEFHQLPQSTPLMWDALVQQQASRTRLSIRTANLELCKTLAIELDRLERLRSKLPLYQRILLGWFENVISLNIDRRLALSRAPNTFPSGEEWQEKDAVFYRHDIIIREGCATRIWYPYGDTRSHQTFRLGLQWHAETLRALEDRRTYLMLDWAGYGRKLRLPNLVYRERLQNLSSWYDLFFLAPLVFIGVRLTLEEWPIWWLLHQRARNFVPFEDTQVPATIYLKTKAENYPELAGKPCEIQMIEFDSHDDLWKAFFSACEF